MAWTDGVNYSTGQLISATIWNNYLGAAGNIDLTAPGVVTTAGDVVYATADNTLARLASSGGGDKFLQMNSGATAPAWVTALTSLVADTTPQLGGFLDANGNYIQMQKGGDIASASPTVIDTDGDYFSVTGTTNFSAMTVAADRHFFLEFAGVLTITHGAGTIDLPGGANITTAASDVGEFYSTAANVVTCVNYTKADGTAVVAAAGGKVLQVVNATHSTQVASTSDTYEDTGLTASITTADSGNKVLVVVHQRGCGKGGSDTGVNLQLLRATSSICVFEARGGYTGGTSNNGIGGCGVVYLDSPNSAASHTYKTQVASYSDSSTAYVQWVGGTANSTISLIELEY